MWADWVAVDYGQLVKKITFNDKKIKQKDYLSSGKIPIIDQGQEIIGGFTNDISKIVTCKLPVIVFGDHTKAVKLIKFQFAPGADGIKVLEPKWFMEPKLLEYFTKLLTFKIIDKGYARHFQHIEKSEIPLPPLLEQKAIVDKIEALFSELDKGVESLQKAKTQLKTYRQSVLKKAFATECQSKKFGSIATIKRGKSKHRPRDDERLFGGQYPFIQTGEIRAAQGKIVRQYSKTYSEFGLSQSRLWQKGTLCLTIAANIAETAFLGFDACFPDSVVGIEADENLLNMKYINYYIQKIKQEIDSQASATAQKNINVDFLEKLDIPYPNIKEQQKIVEEIESRLSVCDKIEATIEESLAKAEALRQSILKKAFEGKLLSAKELENIRNHPEYESAQRLLERIKNKEMEPTKASKTETTKAPKKLSTTDTHAGVIAKVVKAHEEHPEYLKLLSHVKCEKIAHLVESHIGVPLGRMAVKDAAGPDDYNHLMKVEHRAKMLGYFEVKALDIGHSYNSSRNIQKAIEQLENSVEKEQAVRIDALVNTFLKLTLQQAEIVATVYAGWNNLLLDGKNPTDEEIVYESRENWSKRKLDIERWKFFRALEWMRRDDIGLIPRGEGAKVEKPQRGKK